MIRRAVEGALALFLAGALVWGVIAAMALLGGFVAVMLLYYGSVGGGGGMR